MRCRVDLETAQTETLYVHDNGVRSVLYSKTNSNIFQLDDINSTDSIISGSWDKTFRIHSPNDNSTPIIIPVPDKIFTMDIHDNTLVIGMANRLNHIYDIRKLDEPVQRRDSSLKFMTRCIKFTPSGDGSHPVANTNLI